MFILQRVYDLKSNRRKGGEGGRKGRRKGVLGCIATAINLPVVFAEIVNFAPNNYSLTFL